MLRKTDLNQIKSIASSLLFTEINQTEYSPMIIQHPFALSGIVAIHQDGETKILDIAERIDDLNMWRLFVMEEITNSKDMYEIYMMINKPYALTFLKFASPYLSCSDFSELLADAWIRSENSNCDPNLSKTKLLSMFKVADPTILVDEKERNELKSLENPVTVYRGVTSHNANNVRALSWTLDRDVAEWFSKRFGEDGAVYEAQINMKHILALFNGRKEAEVIVDLKYLTDIVQSQEPDFGMTMI